MKIFLGGDAHCGSIVGLTPPAWQQEETQKEMWRWFRAGIKKHGPFDLAVWNGDMIDGKSSRTGSTDVITADRNKQIMMAKQVIKAVNAPENLFTYGTPYHVGKDEDWEESLAREFDSKIKNHAYLRISGIDFSIKHQVGGSTIPHGRFTAIAKEKLWNEAWAREKHQHPESQVVIRSHVHYHTYCGKNGKDWWLAMTLPALQGLGSKYGARQCSGVVDFGFVWMETAKGKIINWNAEIVELESHKNHVEVYD